MAAQSSFKIADSLNYARSFPSLTSTLGNPAAGAGGNNSAVRIANKVLSTMLARPFAFKWNRVVLPQFVTNSLQQDYSIISGVNNIAWLENATACQINSTALPKPLRGIEAVRELNLTSGVGNVDQISWCYNSEAVTGPWTANTTFANPIPGEMVLQPLTQIVDSNGNLQLLTTYGTTGANTPSWPATTAAAGTTTSDGTCVWTLVQWAGQTLRISPCPPQSGTAWLVEAYAQLKPVVITGVNTFWPVPDDVYPVVEAGFIAYAYEAAESKLFTEKYEVFLSKIQEAVGASDREQEAFTISPARGVAGRGGIIQPGDQSAFAAMLWRR